MSILTQMWWLRTLGLCSVYCLCSMRKIEIEIDTIPLITYRWLVFVKINRTASHMWQKKSNNVERKNIRWKLWAKYWHRWRWYTVHYEIVCSTVSNGWASFTADIGTAYKLYIQYILSNVLINWNDANETAVCEEFFSDFFFRIFK